MRMKAIMIILMFYSSTALFPAVKPIQGIQGKILLKTRWGGTKRFSYFNPDHHSPGCHSMTLAQLAFYHGLIPSGSVSYTSSRGYRIQETFTRDRFDMGRVVNSLMKDPTEAEIRATAFYMYAMAVVLRKDFGTDDYMTSPDFHKTQVEAALGCTYTPIVFKPLQPAGEFISATPRFREIIAGELDASRPLGMYYTNFKGSGHAVVVDGIVEKNGTAYIHANYGWGGKNNGWFPLDHCVPDDSKMLLLITLKPKSIAGNR